MIGKLLPALLCCLVPVSSHAQALPSSTDTAQLREFRRESEAFNRQDPYANAYRAGRYNGYFLGVLDTLQGKSICFRGCTCEIDKRIEQYLADHPEVADKPVVAWLVPLLEASYPCK